MNTRNSFSLKRKNWYKKRDHNRCQFPFPHKCDTEHPLQVHHILPHAYLNHVAEELSADYPENGITLCRAAHELIHPDVVWARNGYHRNNMTFYTLRKQRVQLMEDRKIYWDDTWDRVLTVIALKNTRKYQVKHPFPEYHKRRKREEINDFEDRQD